MAGRGFAPKDPSRRVDGGRGKPGLRAVPNTVAEQPGLPNRKGRNWPYETVEWWAMWGRSPLTDEFTENDWDELASAAVFHAMVWSEATPPTVRLKAGSELRQRMAKFGATPEDRARLRIQFSFAEQAEDKAEDAKERRAARAKGGSRQRRGPHLVGEEDTA
jgi:hypothetical protein